MSTSRETIYGGSFAVYRGETRSVPFAPTTPTSVAGQTFEVRIIDPLGNMTEVDIAHGSLTIVTGTGAITATLTAAITAAITANKVEVWLWRTDSGHEGAEAWIELDIFDAGT